MKITEEPVDHVDAMYLKLISITVNCPLLTTM